mgnify:CR=1 FL=1
MRVCFVSLSAYGYFNQDQFSESMGGGAQRQLSLIAKELATRFDVHFVVGDYGQAATEVIDGVTLHRSFEPQGSVIRKPVEMWKLFDAMRSADADVYVSRNKPSLSAFTYVATRLLGRDWVFNVANDRFVEPDGLSELSFPLSVLYRTAVRRADTVIAQTDYQQRRLRTIFGTESTVVPNGYPKADNFVPYEDREYYLWVGHLDPDQKRPELLFELAERVPEAKFLLIGTRGTESYRTAVRERADASDNVDYLLDVPPDQIHQYFSRSIALINTSRYEGFPNTFLEAWRYGTPVLSLEIDIRRFLDGEPVGYADGDLSTLVDSVRELNERLAERKTLGGRVEDCFEKRYTIEAVADRYRAALESR